MKSDTELRKAISDNLVWACGHKSNPQLGLLSGLPGKEHGSPFLFNIIINEKLEDGQYHFNVIYFDSVFRQTDNGRKAEIFAGIAPKPVTEGTFPTWRRIPSKYFVPVSKEEMEFFKTSTLFKQIVERWINHNSKSPENQKFLNYYEEELEHLSDSKNEQICKQVLAAKKREQEQIEIQAKREKTAKELAAYIKEKYPEVKGASYYSEYYVPGRIAHDDDYEGSGGMSIEGVLLALNILSKEKIDKWLGSKYKDYPMCVDDSKFNIRTYYRFLF